MATRKTAKRSASKQSGGKAKTGTMKTAAVKKTATAKKATTVKKAAPVKKTAPVKKAAPAKKAAPVKKAAAKSTPPKTARRTPAAKKSPAPRVTPKKPAERAAPGVIEVERTTVTVVETVAPAAWPPPRRTTRGALAGAAPEAAVRPPEVPEARWNRKLVLDALNLETSVDGGSPEQRRVVGEYRAAPGQASTEDFVFVGALALKNWYVDPSKPGTIEQESLWITLMRLMKKGTANPKNFGPETAVGQLQLIAELTQ